MIPLKDQNPSKKIPWIRNALILVNIAVFFYAFWRTNTELFFENYAFLGSLFLHDPVSRLHTLITYQFLHGGFGHVLGNMWFLMIFGDNVESRLGHLKFLVFYLACGVISCLVQIFLVPQLGVPLVGASGSIAGVLGAYFVFYPKAKIVTWIPMFGFFGYTAKLPAAVFLGIWFLYQFLLGYATPSAYAASGGVAWWAHVGGFVCGLLYALIFR
ncbi:MAG: rhomboid family intramembrane serine protease [Elusimicrobia bacterium]|nr:rhomboid family intramembrane serine protease [Elusimicrobiota bacterium]